MQCDNVLTVIYLQKVDAEFLFNDMDLCYDAVCNQYSNSVLCLTVIDYAAKAAMLSR